jgi:hypothetical protein
MVKIVQNMQLGGKSAMILSLGVTCHKYVVLDWVI